jgi:putative ABC transport system permease protein
MSNLIISILTQSLTFLPLAFAISISYHILRATDMTIDGSFVAGAAVFAKLITMGIPPLLAAAAALCCGAMAGMLAAFIQRGGRVDPLLAGVLATFILSSANLVLMGKPNISLLSQTTLVSSAFEQGDLVGWALTAGYVMTLCLLTLALIKSRFGLTLRAFGDNPALLQRLGKKVELYRLAGFALTNLLSAAAGVFTAQTVGYADIGMGFGMTLTGIGAIILGHQILRRYYSRPYFRIGAELIACLIGVLLYFFSLNLLLSLDINPIYLKMILGILLIIFLRAAVRPQTGSSIS